MPAQFPFEVIDQPSEGHTRLVTVRIELTPERQASDILHYLRSIQVKNDLMNGWVTTHAPGYGMEIRGGPRPVFNDPADRESGVQAYEQEFRLTRPV